MNLKGIIYGVLAVGQLVTLAIDINRREYHEAMEWLNEHVIQDTDPSWWRGYRNNLKEKHLFRYCAGCMGRNIALMDYTLKH